MGTYAVTSDVQARLPGFTLTTSTKPSTTQVDSWITEAEALLEGAMLSGGLTVPNTNTRGIEILTSWASDYAEGHARQALAAAGGDGANDDGKDLLEKFDNRVTDILDHAARYGQMLEGGAAPDGARIVRSYPLNNQDSKTVDDVQPIFTRPELSSDLGSEF